MGPLKGGSTKHFTLPLLCKKVIIKLICMQIYYYQIPQRLSVAGHRESLTFVTAAVLLPQHFKNNQLHVGVVHFLTALLVSAHYMRGKCDS